jgi:hypothetical protein
MVGCRRVVFASIGLVSALAACAEPDPRFGDPNGIVNRSLPKEPAGAGGGGGGFTDAYSAAANKPTTTLRAEHAKGPGRPAPESVTDCLGCHVAGGQATNKPFDFGGRVGGNKPDVDVLVVGADGAKLGPVKSDADGFFWSPGGASIKAGSHVFMRSAKGPASMNGELGAGKAGGGCMAVQCHGTAESPPGQGV